LFTTQQITASQELVFQPNNLPAGFSLKDKALNLDLTWPEYFMPIYAFRRGGMNVKFAVVNVTTSDTPQSTQPPLMMLSAFNQTDYTGSDYTAVPQAAPIYTINETGLTRAAVQPLYFKTEGIPSASIPYYSSHHCLLNELAGEASELLKFYFNPHTVDDAYIPQNYYSINSQETGGQTQVSLFTAGRDDYELLFFIGVPTCIYIGPQPSTYASNGVKQIQTIPRFKSKSDPGLDIQTARVTHLFNKMLATAV
jgi:hypothetical protein